MKTFFISLVLLATIPLSVLAGEKDKDNQLIMNLQLRPRAEYRNGSINPRMGSDDAAAFINNRSRLSLGYTTEGMSMGLSIQNAGVWGQDPQVSKSPNLGIHEAWAQLNSQNGFFVKIGRQTLVYDDERLLGALDWNTAGRSHDVLKTGFENKSHKIHLALAYNQNAEHINGGSYYNSTGQPYKTMQTLWYQYNGFSQVFKPSFLFMNLGLENGNPITRVSELAYMQTFGTYLSSTNSNGLGLNLSAYFQTGTTRSNETISAWMISAKGSYAINKQLALTVGSDRLSGEETANNNTSYNAFNPLYGTHHKFYGAMDYFYASSFAGNLNPGLWDNYLGISYKPAKNLSVSATYHYFAITADIADSNNSLYNKGLGSEIDLQLDWVLRKDVRLSCGYSSFFGTGTMDRMKGGDHTSWQDWGWISINFNPELLKLKF